MSEDQPGGILDPVARRLRLPFSTPEFVDKIISGSVNQVGRRTLATLFTAWDLAGGGPFAASAIAGTGLAKTVDMLQGQFAGPVFKPVLQALGADEILLRASLCSSQVVGLAILRYGVRSEPIKSMEVGKLVDLVAPTVQRYLIGPLD